jgi:hypothetical protein
MEDLILEETIDTHGIKFQHKSGELEITGRSYPEDTRKFFGPVLAWIDSFCSSGPENVRFNIKLNYFNSSSYKPLFDILSKLKTIQENGTRVHVEWHYKNGDDDMLEAGQEFEDLTELKFNYHSF